MSKYLDTGIDLIDVPKETIDVVDTFFKEQRQYLEEPERKQEQEPQQQQSLPSSSPSSSKKRTSQQQQLQQQQQMLHTPLNKSSRQSTICLQKSSEKEARKDNRNQIRHQLIALSELEKEKKKKSYLQSVLKTL